MLNARHLPYGLAVAPLLRGPLWKRALSSQIVLDESTALALAQPTPELGRLAFYACGCALFVTWNLGTLAGALAGGAIADPVRARPRCGVPGEHAGAARTAPATPRHARGRARGSGARTRGDALHRARRADPARRGRRARGALRAGGAGVTWWAIFTLAAGTYTLKAAGPLALGSPHGAAAAAARAQPASRSRCSPRLVAISTFGRGPRASCSTRARRGSGSRSRPSGCARPSRSIVIAATPTAAALRALGAG